MNAATALGGRSTSLAEPHNLSEMTSELMLLPLDAKFPRNGNTFISDYLVQCRCIQSWQYWAALSSRGHCWVSILPTRLKCRWSEISFVGPTSSAFRNLEKCGLKHCTESKPRAAKKWSCVFDKILHNVQGDFFNWPPPENHKFKKS